jgi:hypothetical protein
MWIRHCSENPEYKEILGDVDTDAVIILKWVIKI